MRLVVYDDDNHEVFATSDIKVIRVMLYEGLVWIKEVHDKFAPHYFPHPHRRALEWTVSKLLRK